MLALDSVTVRAGQATLLDALSLHVAPGEVVAVVGPNGAGKTTALRVLAGETVPANGRVLLDGRPLAETPAAALALRRAVLPQESALAFGFTALDVVLLGRTPHRSTRRDDLAAAGSAMAQAGVDGLADRRYPTLSGGERQRVHLARALAQLDGTASGDGAPAGRYLLLDEPTSALDLGHQHAVLKTARRQAAEGVGVLAVLHDLNLAAQYADRIAVLAAGRLVAVGPPHAVLTPTIVRCAFGITVMVTAHPCAACPLVVPVPDGVDLAFGALPVLDLPTLSL
ncbi:MAG TPA: heme ABC transporter ATP-binding protein [Rubricoccaceae bacterium]|jgi:iron complex transport system ATP-binding protein